MNPRIIPLWPEGSVNNPPDRPPPAMEIFYPFVHNRPSSAVVVICPGGGYAKHGAYVRMYAELMRSLGHTAVVVNYRLPPPLHPAAYMDVARAIRLLRRHGREWDLPAERLVLMGGSAGGHVAALVGSRPDEWKDAEDDLAASVSARPDRLVLMYPVMSAVEPFAHRSLQSYLGKNASEALRVDVSPERHVGLLTPPTFLLHAADDDNVTVENSVVFARACWNAGVPVELHIFPRGGHGPTLSFTAENPVRWRELLSSWLDEWLRFSRPGAK